MLTLINEGELDVKQNKKKVSLLKSSFLGVPICATHVGGRWVLGDLLCKVNAHSFSVLACSSLNFTAMVGLHR